MFSELRQKLIEAITPIIARANAMVAPYVAQAQARYRKLDKRERALVTAGACLFGLVLVYEFLYLPIVDFSSGLSDQIADRQRQLTQVQGSVQAYLRLKTDLANARSHAAPSGPDFSLFSVVEKALTDSVGRDKLSSITPAADRKLSPEIVQHSVDLQMTKLSLNQIVDALYSMRTLSVPVVVANLHIKRRPEDSHSYDVDMTCTTVGRNG